MLRWLMEPLAPSTFTKGIQLYSRGEYEKAQRLLKKAAKWMPELGDDGLYCAYKLLINFHLKGEIEIEAINTTLEKMKESDLRNTVSSKNAERELHSVLSQISNINSGKEQQ